MKQVADDRPLSGQPAHEDLREWLLQAREHISAELGERSLTPSDEVSREIRSERDAQSRMCIDDRN